MMNPKDAAFLCEIVIFAVVVLLIGLAGWGLLSR
jgi:hypothetical protein